MEHQKFAGLLLTLIILLAPFDYGFLDLQILTINLILSLLLISTWLRFAIKKGEISFYINPVTIIISIFFILCLLSLIYSIHPYSSLTEVMRVFTYLAVFFTSANFLSRESFRKIFSLIAVWMGILAIHGLGEYLFGHEEIKSVFVYHCTFAAFLLLTFPLAFSLKRHNSLFLWLGAIGFFAFIVTQSRSAWLSLIMGSLIFAPFAFTCRGLIHQTHGKVVKGRSSNAIIMAFVLLFLLLFIFDCVFMNSVLIGRAGTLFSPGNISSAQARVKYWDSAVGIAKKYFPAGTGIQTFYLIYPFFKHPSFSGCTHHFVHNDYLQLLSELGPLGLIAFLGIVFYYVSTLRSAVGKGGEDSRILLAIYLSSLAFFIACFFEFNIYIPSLMVIVYLYMAFVSKEKGKLIKIRLLLSSGTSKKTAVFIYPILLALIILAAFPYIGQMSVKKGDAALRKGNVSTAVISYKTAVFFSPLNSLPHEKLARIYISQQRLEEAVEEGISAVRLNSFKKENHELMRDILKSNGKL